MVQLSREQQKLVDKIAKENGLSDYEVSTAEGSGKGDNFLGILIALTLKSRSKHLDLILKSAHESDAFRKAVPLRKAYLREILVYDTLFREFQKFQDEHGVSDPFRSYAKVYGSSVESGSECFVMENLRDSGYGLWDKRKPMNSEHISLVLREYGKFHATSVAFKEKKPDLFGRLAESMEFSVFDEEESDKRREKVNIYIQAICSSAYEAIKDDDEMTDVLKKFEKKIVGFLFNDYRSPQYKSVFIHGDCWCNNFMFKYEDNNNTQQPSGLKIIDWQLSFVSSPGYDFCYFFLAHSPKEILDDYPAYLRLYYESFSKQLKCFGCDPDTVFPFDKMKDHVDKFMLFGFYMCLLVLKLMLVDSEKAPNFEKLSETDGNVFQGLDFKVTDSVEFRRRIENILVFLRDNRFIAA